MADIDVQEMYKTIDSDLSKIDRNGLPFLLTKNCLNGTGVEIGVWQGRFSDWILSNSNLSCLISIDPWEAYDTGRLNGKTISQNAQDRIYQEAKDLLEKYGERSKILKKTSEEAAFQIPCTANSSSKLSKFS